MRILVIGPKFHGYTEAIACALKYRGHQVFSYHYDLAQNIRAKLLNKVIHDVPESLIPARLKHLTGQAAINAVERTRPEAVLVIRGDILGPEFWHELAATRRPVVAWFYDELERMSFQPGTLAQIPIICSYSAMDVSDLRVRGIEAYHLPLAFDHLTRFQPVISGNITLIGARYRSREELLRALAARQVPVRAYGRDWSRNPYDILRSRQLRSAGIPCKRGISRSDAYGVMAGCVGTLNIHEGQDGFTMRTFEACGVGAVQFIDREDVAPLFEPEKEILIFKSPDHIQDYYHRIRRDRKWARTIADKGQQRALGEHTFVHRMDIVERLWG